MSFDNKFRRLTLFLIRRKYPNIDLSDIDFSSMEGHDVPDPDDCIDEGFDSKSGLSKVVTAPIPTFNSVIDPLVLNIDSLSL